MPSADLDIPRLHFAGEYGMNSGYYALVLDQLGPDLDKLRRNSRRERFTPHQTLAVAIQTVSGNSVKSCRLHLTVGRFKYTNVYTCMDGSIATLNPEISLLVQTHQAKGIGFLHSILNIPRGSNQLLVLKRRRTVSDGTVYSSRPHGKCT